MTDRTEPETTPFAGGAAYIRGRFVPMDDAVIPVTDWGFTRSDVVYDVVHVHRGAFFRLADHLDRFERAMARRRLTPAEDRAAIEDVLHRCVATVKNYQWSDLTSGLLEAHDHGYDTAILCDHDGFVTEGPGFNVFIVKDGRVLTPDRGSLEGITRRTVLDICADRGIEAAITPIPRALLDDADEVFTTTTAGGVMPAARVGNRILGNDRPGPVTMQLHDAYWQAHDDDRYRTPVRQLAVQS